MYNENEFSLSHNHAKRTKRFDMGQRPFEVYV